MTSPDELFDELQQLLNNDQPDQERVKQLVNDPKILEVGVLHVIDLANNASLAIGRQQTDLILQTNSVEQLIGANGSLADDLTPLLASAQQYFSIFPLHEIAATRRDRIATLAGWAETLKRPLDAAKLVLAAGRISNCHNARTPRVEHQATIEAAKLTLDAALAGDTDARQLFFEIVTDAASEQKTDVTFTLAKHHGIEPLAIRAAATSSLSDEKQEIAHLLVAARHYAGFSLLASGANAKQQESPQQSLS